MIPSLQGWYGLLVIVGECEPDARGRRQVLVNCDCGNVGVKKLDMYIRWGETKSCGCRKRTVLGDSRRKHGRTVTPEYRAWQHMKTRCSKASHRDFQWYGGRGITVCEEWRDDFSAFVTAVGLRPSPRHSIDRIDVNGNYEPGNVRWATQAEQMRNTRRTRMLTHAGKTQSMRDWANEVGITYDTIRDRLNQGWPVDLALTQSTRAPWGIGRKHR